MSTVLLMTSICLVRSPSSWSVLVASCCGSNLSPTIITWSSAAIVGFSLDVTVIVIVL